MHRCSQIIALALLLAVAAPVWAQETLVVYSGRSKTLVEPLIKRFEQETGIQVEERYGDTAQLAAALREEGGRSPADVFWAQDAGALGAVVKAGLFTPIPEEVMTQVPEAYRSQDDLWVGTSGRARVLAYSPRRVTEGELPRTMAELTDPKWRGRIGWAPTNASFQSFITALRKSAGDDEARAWLEGMKANGAKAYPRNSAIIEGIAAGEVDLGLPNHYYLLNFKARDPNIPVEQTSFAAGDTGNLVNVAGVGILKSSRRQEAARRFVSFLLSPESQTYFMKETHEYPVNLDEAPAGSKVSPEELRELSPRVDLESLDDLERTLALLRQVGLI